MLGNVGSLAHGRGPTDYLIVFGAEWQTIIQSFLEIHYNLLLISVASFS
jgi:hypothetical protein